MDADALTIRNLLVRDRAGRLLLQVPEFSLAHGEVCGVYGAAVDGVNLFLGCAAGLCRPTQGSIHVYGRELHASFLDTYPVGVLPREGGLFPDFTAGANLKLALRFSMSSRSSRQKKKQQFTRILSLLELEYWMQTQANQLPVGVVQRLALACALVHEPRLLVADDPWGRADTSSRELIEHALREHCDRGNTLLFTSPREEEIIGLSSEICLFSRSALVARGTLDHLRQYLGTQETIVVRVQEQSSALVERLSALSGVLGCEVAGSVVTIQASPGAIRLTRLAEHVQALGLELLDMQIRKPGLSDIYAAVCDDGTAG